MAVVSLSGFVLSHVGSYSTRGVWLSVVVVGAAVVVGALLGAAGAFAFQWRRVPASASVVGLAVDDVPTAVVRCTDEFSITDSNRSLQDLLGYPPEIARGLTLPQLAAESDRQRLRRRLAAVTGPPSTLQLACRGVDGEPRMTEWHIARVSSGFFVSLLPLKQGLSQEQARSMARLREPLMTLVGTVDELQQQSLPEGVRKPLQLVVRATHQITDALHDVTGSVRRRRATPNHRPRQVVPSGRSQRTVLVVEDNDVNAVILRRSLMRLGLDSHRARDGQEALRLLEQPLFDAVLMDCQMPVMDGYETTRNIRATPGLATLPVIAVTAHAHETDKERCLRAGMDDHITKPVRIEDLRAVLTEWVGPLLASNSLPPVHTVDLEALEQLRSLLGEEFDATVRLFVTDAQAVLTIAEEAFESRDWEALSRAVHSLKSTSAYVGATPVAEACARVVKQARAEEPEEMTAQLASLRRGVEVASEVLQTQVGSTVGAYT